MTRNRRHFTDEFKREAVRLLADSGIVCSMSKRGDCWDNAAMESFFSTLKTERLSRRIHRSRDECRAEVFDYIERFYNPRRQHSTLGSAPCSLRQRLVRLNNLSEGMGQAQFDASQSWRCVACCRVDGTRLIQHSCG